MTLWHGKVMLAGFRSSLDSLVNQINHGLRLRARKVTEDPVANQRSHRILFSRSRVLMILDGYA